MATKPPPNRAPNERDPKKAKRRFGQKIIEHIGDGTTVIELTRATSRSHSNALAPEFVGILHEFHKAGQIYFSHPEALTSLAALAGGHDNTGLSQWYLDAIQPTQRSRDPHTHAARIALDSRISCRPGG